MNFEKYQNTANAVQKEVKKSNAKAYITFDSADEAEARGFALLNEARQKKGKAWVDTYAKNILIDALSEALKK